VNTHSARKINNLRGRSRVLGGLSIELRKQGIVDRLIGGRPVVFELLAEPIRQPGQPANLHPHGEVLSSTCEVQIFAGSGFPLITIGMASTTSAGEQRCSPSRGGV
jgi:hypothetical protein